MAERDASHQRVLVADATAAERDRSVRILAQAGHTTFIAQDDHGTVEAIRSETPDVVLVDPSFHPNGTAHLISHLRSVVSDRYLYIIIAMPAGPGSDITVAFASGANDFMRKPFSKEELLARVNGLRRLNAYAAQHGGDSKKLKGHAAQIDVTQLTCWRMAQEVVCEALSDMVGTKLGRSPAALTEELRYAAEAVLTLPESSTEVHVRVGLSQAAAERLSIVLLGSQPEEPGMMDMLYELTNTAAGSLKRAALSDGMSFTLGLPRPIAPGLPGAGSIQTWSMGREQGMAMQLSVSVLVQEVRRVRLDALHEGMVCATDVRNASGLLLAAAGTRITEAAAERLRKLLGEGFAVEVVFGRAA
ncbi:MAG: hypothetical protein U1E65_15675 [Myxococcota bacterium]